VVDDNDFGNGVTQPLSQLLKVRAANGMAAADVEASLGGWRATRTVALKVHEVYSES